MKVGLIINCRYNCDFFLLPYIQPHVIFAANVDCATLLLASSDDNQCKQYSKASKTDSYKKILCSLVHCLLFKTIFSMDTKIDAHICTYIHIPIGIFRRIRVNGITIGGRGHNSRPIPYLNTSCLEHRTEQLIHFLFAFYRAFCFSTSILPPMDYARCSILQPCFRHLPRKWVLEVSPKNFLKCIIFTLT